MVYIFLTISKHSNANLSFFVVSLPTIFIDTSRLKALWKTSTINNKNSGKAYVTYPSGKSKKINFFSNPKIYPGSKIFLSFKLKEEKESGRFFDRFTTIFSVLTGALTTVVLAKQLSN